VRPTRIGTTRGVREAVGVNLRTSPLPTDRGARRLAGDADAAL